MAYVLALAAAFAFALGTVLQQKGTLEAPAAQGDPRWLTQVFGRPVWLAGAGCQAGGWVLQAVALDRGSLIVVQSMTTLSLVIALPLGARITHQRVDTRVRAGAWAVVVGIVLFLALGTPQAGTSAPTAATWWTVGLCSSVVVGALAAGAAHRQGAVKAALLGSAAGVAFALQASVTKVFVGLVGQGLSAVVHSWTTYVLVATALVGFAFQQGALRTDALAPALGSSNAMTLFASVVFGVTLFGDTLSKGNGRVAPSVIGLLVALGGVALLATGEPQASSLPTPSLDPATGSPDEPPAQNRAGTSL
ncbi:MAG TPA: DMT family transporter [Acidimicrobiales bacterium]|nr:DMT family transporter [Acidimicrobiales bacterium]